MSEAPVINDVFCTYLLQLSLEEKMASSAEEFKIMFETGFRERTNVEIILASDADHLFKKMHETTIELKKTVVDVALKMKNARTQVNNTVQKAGKTKMYNKANVDKFTFDVFQQATELGVFIAQYREEMLGYSHELKKRVFKAHVDLFIQWCTEFIDTVINNAVRNIDILSRVSDAPLDISPSSYVPLPDSYYDENAEDITFYEAVFPKNIVDMRKNPPRLCAIM